MNEIIVTEWWQGTRGKEEETAVLELREQKERTYQAGSTAGEIASASFSYFQMKEINCGGSEFLK